MKNTMQTKATIQYRRTHASIQVNIVLVFKVIGTLPLNWLNHKSLNTLQPPSTLLFRFTSI